MKNLSTLMLFVSSTICMGQNVGINTTTPEASLDVNGNVMIETVPTATDAPTYDYMVQNPTTKEVQKINGSYAAATNTTVAKATASAGISLLGASLFADWQRINFDPANVSINTGTFNTTTDEYTVPSDGIYEITYYVRYGTGVQASLLGGDVKIGVLRQTPALVNTVLDERLFAGVNLVLGNVTISSSEINSVYALNAGDKISFAIDQGGISLGLLGSSFASFVVKKISN